MSPVWNQPSVITAAVPLRVFVVAVHHFVAADHHLAHGLHIARHVLHMQIHHPDLDARYGPAGHGLVPFRRSASSAYSTVPLRRAEVATGAGFGESVAAHGGAVEGLFQAPISSGEAAAPPT
jgi:hypothetical protein